METAKAAYLCGIINSGGLVLPLCVGLFYLQQFPNGTKSSGRIDQAMRRFSFAVLIGAAFAMAGCYFLLANKVFFSEEVSNTTFLQHQVGSASSSVRSRGLWHFHQKKPPYYAHQLQIYRQSTMIDPNKNDPVHSRTEARPCPCSF